MKTISHFCENLNTLSVNLYFLKTHLEPLALLDEVPATLDTFFNSADINHLIQQAELALHSLNDALKPHLKTILNATKSFTPSSKDQPIPYADFTIDEPPLVKDISDFQNQLSFDEIHQLALENGKMLKPVKRKKMIDFKHPCPHCNAPNDYIYDNNNKGTQFRCKACSNTFSLKFSPRSKAGFYCPHCKTKLSLSHERSKYSVFSCQNKKCSFYLQNKNALDTEAAIHLRTSSNQHKLRYHYRQFDFNLQSLKDHALVCATKVNLTKIHCDQNTLGLIMTYYINYGLSTRKTALILKQVHGINISHQTVANYAQSVASLIKPLVDSYQHKNISPTIVGDETYIKVRSKNHYVFFFSDPTSKAILSYEIFKKRDTEAACISMWNVLKKFKNAFPDDLTFITDGNPIYNAAQLFFKMQDISFDLLQVIGVSNKDDLSKKYRSFKQIEERLNRTYKQNYHGTNGYHSLHSANSYMVAYVAFFNFLRPHSTLNYSTPLQLDCFNSSDLMPDKWLKLLQLSPSYTAA